MSDSYDDKAERFYKETGLYAPGKDVSPHEGPPDAFRAIEQAWQLWCECEVWRNSVPSTEDDNKCIIPGESQVWIDPCDRSGWMDPDQAYEFYDFDENEKPVAACRPWLVKVLGVFRGHFSFHRVGKSLGEDYWQGKCYSTSEAVLAAREQQ